MKQLSVELRYLIYVAILLAIIWLPYILAHIAQVGPVKALAYTNEGEMPAWAKKLKQAHYNLVEIVPIFAIAVISPMFTPAQRRSAPRSFSGLGWPIRSRRWRRSGAHAPRCSPSVLTAV